MSITPWPRGFPEGVAPVDQRGFAGVQPHLQPGREPVKCLLVQRIHAGEDRHAICDGIADQHTKTCTAGLLLAELVDDQQIAIVMDDLGIDQARTRRVIALPAPLTLAFLVYGNDIAEQTEAAAAAGLGVALTTL